MDNIKCELGGNPLLLLILLIEWVWQVIWHRRTNSKRTPPQCFGKWTCVGFSFQVHYQLSCFKRLFSGCFEGIARTFGFWAVALKKFIECLVPSKVDDWIYILVK